MYCGDETGGIIGDIGAHTCKFGFAGEDLPKTSVTSVIGYDAESFAKRNVSKRYVGLSSIRHRQHEMDVRKLISGGEVTDWDAMEAMWDYGISHMLSTSFRKSSTQTEGCDHPILVCSPTVDTDASRAKQLELLFEKFSTPAVFLARDAMLSAFSMGRANALIVDVGASGTTCAPVWEGHVLQNSVSRSAVGGDVVDERMLRILEELSEKPVRPPSTFKACVPSVITGTLEPRVVKERDPSFVGRIQPSYLQWEKLRVAEDAKHSVCYVLPSLNPKFGNVLKPEDMYETDDYELPDGTIVEFGSERFQAVEVLIDPTVPAFGGRSTPAQSSEAQPTETTVNELGIPDLILSSLSKCDADSRKDFLQQILLVGGGSLTGGLSERCSTELSVKLPSSHRARFQTPLPMERQFSSWIGGSVLASLGSFQQMWVSRAEYEEHGANVMKRVCYH